MVLVPGMTCVVGHKNLPYKANLKIRLISLIAIPLIIKSTGTEDNICKSLNHDISESKSEDRSIINIQCLFASVPDIMIQ